MSHFRAMVLIRIWNIVLFKDDEMFQKISICDLAMFHNKTSRKIYRKNQLNVIIHKNHLRKIRKI